MMTRKFGRRSLMMRSLSDQLRCARPCTLQGMRVHWPVDQAKGEPGMRYVLERLFIAFTVCWSVSGAALSQAWPSRPILVVSGTGLGNPGDTALRLIAPKMSD